MGQVLIFSLGVDDFGIPIGNAVEVLRTRPVRKVPDMPDYIEGFVRVRKDMVPLIDMRKRFGVQSAALKERVLVVRYSGERVGLLVDNVTGIVKYEDNAFRPPPSVFRGLKSKYMAGILELDGRSIVFLDVANVLSSREKIALKKAKEKLKQEKNS